MCTVRKAKRNDAKVLFPMAKELATSFEVDEDSFLNSFDEMIKNDSMIILVAEDNNIPIGYVMGLTHHAFYANGLVGWVEELFVKEEFRKGGCGKSLMDSFETIAQERGSKLVSLSTRRAASFYESIGYEESATYFKKTFD